ncbi:MAG: hypothetical protein JSW70_10360 [Syntrophobacterales bacterium]|nr:MAG: hypothetical protein JSW70_10360 [Syntrophobacterales bacterium]
MIRLDIPGREAFRFENIVLDLNRTLSFDGKIQHKARGKNTALTADTRGGAEQILGKLQTEIVLLSGDNTSREKAKATLRR